MKSRKDEDELQLDSLPPNQARAPQITSSYRLRPCSINVGGKLLKSPVKKPASKTIRFPSKSIRYRASPFVVIVSPGGTEPKFDASRPGISHSYTRIRAEQLTGERHQQKLAILEGDHPPPLGGKGRENQEWPQSWKISSGLAAYAASASSRVTVTVSSAMVGFAADRRTRHRETQDTRNDGKRQSRGLHGSPSNPQVWKPPNPSAPAGHASPLVASYPPERPTIYGTCLTFCGICLQRPRQSADVLARNLEGCRLGRSAGIVPAARQVARCAVITAPKPSPLLRRRAPFYLAVAAP